MDRKHFYETGDKTSDSAKAKELGRRHALEDIAENTKRPHSIDAHKDYLSSYAHHHSGLKEHQSPYWDKK